MGSPIYIIINPKNMKEKVYWRGKNGEKIDIDEMSIDHLRNALKMAVKNAEQRNIQHAIEKSRQYERIQEKILMIRNIINS